VKGQFPVELLYTLDAIVLLLSFLIRDGSQGYNADLVDNQFEALSIDRLELLKKNVKPDKKVFPLVLDYNPILPDIQKVIQKYAHLLRSSPELLEIFPSKSIFPAYRRTKNLKDILAPSRFCEDRGVNQVGKETGGCFKCSSRCDLCKNFLIQDSKFKSFSTGRTNTINLTCLVLPKMLFTWPRVRNAIYST